MRITLERRLTPLPFAHFVIPAASFVLALVVCAFVLAFAGVSPIEAYKEMFLGVFGSGYSLSETFVKAIPLILCGLGVALAFKMELWNIGAEGQFFMGAMAASFVALKMGNLSPWVVIPLMMLSGAAAGGLWGLIPGAFKAFAGANEAITTLMMNYVAILWVDYLVYGPWKDPSGYGFPETAQFGPNTYLPVIGGTRVHLGLAFGILLAAVLWVVFDRTRWGYEIKVTGANPNAARYAGINITKNVLLVMFLSGALAGLAGMAEVSGIQHRLQHGFSAGYGYSAIIVAWLARLNPWGILLSAFLFGSLLVGGDQLQISMSLPVSFSYILQGAILFFILGGSVLADYAPRIKK
jgi:simple sugar transport system permease protein